MTLGQQILFFFSGIGAFNGLLLGVYLLVVKKQKDLSNLFLGLLLLMLSIRIGKSVFLYFDHDLPKIYRQIGLSTCLLIGPALYYYIRSLDSHEKSDLKSWKYMFGIITGIIIIGGYFFSYETFPNLWDFYIVKFIYLEWGLFLIWSGYEYIKYMKNKKVELQTHASSVYFSNMVIFLAYLFFLMGWVRGAYIAGSITFSFLLYLNFFFFFDRKKGTDIRKENIKKYSNKKIPVALADNFMSRLEMLMKTDELYKNPNLKLSDLATKMNISTHQLSQLLNDNFGKSFSIYINEYRIHEACERIVTDTNLKIEEIGYEVGFNSKSTFFTTFKRIKNTTPLLYREKILKNNEADLKLVQH
ncbi:helix-turn-helix domain-containing protein [Elizabethkingia anophelis]|uniref:helix-turn-helix domain-containing protein n=1 Tax=Elizabethkingia anophelis TaxID=1117645 RepID=UPI00137010F2|nr:helix-turn-helix domain-containing protein [Elizabethkingia anophelis]MCT4123655.1 AraC family transcriptional regulator [Elizabethkingia anophelis]MCT4325137.1 AraC family transcriptional regulator [Elizabethkingia anophelis]MYY42604.1 AraC family transcriptional regulator [Elizabethkingia anophelis]